MMLILGRCHSSLQAFQDDLAFRDGQPYGGGRQQVLALNGGYFPFNSLPRSGFGNQLHLPSHPASLTHPTTLHALNSLFATATRGRGYFR
jgi:hypothetical protein